MTAEIAILNNGAVALAADSAVTWSAESASKVYNTANKLFTLSKYQPIGVMVYGNSDLMGLPWETVIKIYRHQAEAQRFDQVEQYATAFLQFLSESRLLFPEEAQRTHVARTTAGYLRRVKVDIDRRVQEITKTGPITNEQLEAVVNELANQHRVAAEAGPLLDSVTDADIEAAIAAYADPVNQALEAVFESMAVPDQARADLHRLSANLFARARFAIPNSGVVIAGFGHGEVTPSLCEFIVAGVVLNKLRHRKVRSHLAAQGPGIFPFAQRATVATFMEGINPEFKNAVGTFVNKVLTELPGKLMAVLEPHLAALQPDARTALLGSLQAVCTTVDKGLKDHVTEYSRRAHIDPIVDAVAALPREQLAEMAEAFVNLTSFRQKVSGETETVGGPVDVAVISKGDGFIWIKRKHYFKSELNQHFFANYYRIAPERAAAPGTGAAGEVPSV